MKKSLSFSGCALAVTAMLQSAWAADVPAGTTLASSQELVRHIKDEPASLDPIRLAP